MFNKKDTICFFGDSITADGSWEMEVFSHLKGAKVYNCGSPGDNTSIALSRIYDTCLIYNPTHVVVMFGMNDCEREICNTPNFDKEKPFQKYAANMRKIVEIFQKFNVQVILCTPTPYDEITDYETENLYADSSLERFAAFIKDLAKQRGLPVVDFHKLVGQAMKQKGITAVCDDRVHPTTQGYHLLGQIFMAQLGLIDEIDYGEQPKFIGVMWDKLSLERMISRMRYVEYGILFPHKQKKILTVAERRAILNEMIDGVADGDWVGDSIKLYLNEIDKLPIHIKNQLEYTNILSRLFCS